MSIVTEIREVLRANAKLLKKAAIICLGMTVAVQAAVFAFSRHYLIGYSPQTETSLPWRFLLAERTKGVSPISRGQIRQFALPNNASSEHFPEGVVFTKVVAGMPGDQYAVTAEGSVFINGEFWGELDLRVLNKLQRMPADFVTVGIVPPNAYLMLGTGKRSYDSRYFGAVPQHLIKGQSWPLV